MKHLLLALSAFICISFSTNAQSIVAGQTSGVLYTDIIPDRVATATMTASTISQLMLVSDSLDLNLDGQYDITWAAYISHLQLGLRYSSESSGAIKPMHSNLELVALSGPPNLIIGFDAQTVVANTVPQTTPPTIPRVWMTYAGLRDLRPALAYKLESPVSSTTWGFWADGQDRYLAVRLRTSSSAPWTYGWIRIQVSNFSFSSVTVTVKDYAFEQNVLSNKPTAANDTWQVYPNPVECVLTLQPKKLGNGQVKLFDVQGRMVLATPSRVQEKQDLDLSSLPAGVYILHLTTAQGTITKRINKL